MNLLDKLFGPKYYAVIVNDRVQDYIVSTPFKTKRRAKEFKLSIKENRTLTYVQTVSFRSKKELEAIEVEE